MNLSTCTSSSYLGHWTQNGVMVLPAAVAASVEMAAAAAAIKPYWKNGENLVNALRIELWNVMTEPKLVRLEQPIVLDMAEVCR